MDPEFDQLATLSMGALKEFLQSKDHGKEDIAAARVASSVLASWSRHKQTEGAREATLFMMARELAKDQDELQQYIAIAAPASPFAKALPPKAISQ